MDDQRQPMSLRDTAKGVAVRASVLGVVGLIVGAWLFGLAAKAASGIVKLLVGLLLLTVGGGVAAWKVRQARRRYNL
jgi:membrane protein DedA with SNARE-associated domain